MDIHEATIKRLEREIGEMKKRDLSTSTTSGDYSINMAAVGRAANDNEGANDQMLDEEVSSLGTVLTVGHAGLLKDLRFTSFVNRRAFRYAKYWVAARDVPPESALATYFKDNWYEDCVARSRARHPCFDEWWVYNGQYIRQRLSQKRTNNIGQLRKVFRGKLY